MDDDNNRNNNSSNNNNNNSNKNSNTMDNKGGTTTTTIWKIEREIENILIIAPNLPQAYFLRYLNCLGHQEYEGATESLHQYLLACREDGFHAARRRLRELLDAYGLAGTDFVNQLHKELYSADFLIDENKLYLTELMAEIDFRLVEGGGEVLQLDALTARICQVLSK